ncbi:hypothetical protein [Archangium sp.]|uniref:hypothetical protein n=1 Tax=Archangium sp. TaxID=1872627 RepID=UPI002D39C499|nr:hypothetical protein [Archangium sp.]HYO57996.1 hypothetical protein [Archangium sp.]
MSIWQKLSSRFRGHSEDEAQRPGPGLESPGMTYADLERDKELKERQLSGVFSPPFGKDASAVEEDE